jgi:gamma-glutamyltranspeptidase / glutathione hydrolase
MFHKASVGMRFRQFTLSALAAALLAGCASETTAPGTLGAVQGFFGAVAADEPQAALVGRDILTAGGSAADAAVAMYFTMAVTLPSQASLGGGGVCLSFNYASNDVAALDFLARAPAHSESAADRPTAIPGNIRGFYALHALYGRLRWAQLLTPAENLARFGVPVSRALATDLASVKDALAVEPAVRRIFATDGGRRLVGEGDTFVQYDLAATLARLRVSGPGDFYSGAQGAQFVAAVQAAGGTLDREDLAAYQPVWRDALGVGYDDRKAYFAPPPTAGGAIAGQMWAMLVKDDRYLDTPDAMREAVLAETAERSFSSRARWDAGIADPQELVSSAYIETLLGDRPLNVPAPPDAVPPRQPRTENPAAATLVAMDRDGSAVACVVTLNSLFGTGRVAAGTGIVLASQPGQGGRGAAMLGPMLVVQPRGRQFVFAGAASGGVTAPTSLADVAARTVLADQPLSAAIAAKRIHGGSDPRFVYAEPGASVQSLQALIDRGRNAVTTESPGRVNAIACPEGLRTNQNTCVAATDPRGFGLAAGTE